MKEKWKKRKYAADWLSLSIYLASNASNAATTMKMIHLQIERTEHTARETVVVQLKRTFQLWTNESLDVTLCQRLSYVHRKSLSRLLCAAHNTATTKNVDTEPLSLARRVCECCVRIIPFCVCVCAPVPLVRNILFNTTTQCSHSIL